VVALGSLTLKTLEPMPLSRLSEGIGQDESPELVQRPPPSYAKGRPEILKLKSVLFPFLPLKLFP
jgi:hypothetical protein